jgi:hypothetical protein
MTNRNHLRTLFLTIGLSGLALTAAACGDDDDAATAGDASTGGGAASTCVEGTVDCVDTPGLGGEGGVASNPDGSVSVADAAANQIDGPFILSGVYFSDSAGTRLCELIAESFPPQCGGATVNIDNSAGVDLGPLTTEGDVTWSDGPINVEGQFVDGVFVVQEPTAPAEG